MSKEKVISLIKEIKDSLFLVKGMYLDNDERLMLFEEMFKYGIAFDKHDHHLIGKLVGV